MKHDPDYKFFFFLFASFVLPSAADAWFQMKDASIDLLSQEEGSEETNFEDGVAIEVPDGGQKLMQKLSHAEQLSDAQLNETLVMKELQNLLTYSSSPERASQSNRRSTSSKRPAGRRSSARVGDQTADLEELLTEETIPIDPFSKQEIQFAVRNKKCKHVYDRSALESFLSQSKNPRCPTLGCVNRAHMTAASVEVDDQTNALIARLTR